MARKKTETKPATSLSGRLLRRSALVQMAMPADNTITGLFRKRGQRIPQSAYSSRALLFKRQVEELERLYGLDTKPRGTPPKRHDNIIGGLSRGERKRKMRALTVELVNSGQTIHSYVPAQEAA